MLNSSYFCGHAAVRYNGFACSTCVPHVLCACASHVMCVCFVCALHVSVFYMRFTCICPRAQAFALVSHACHMHFLLHLLCMKPFYRHLLSFHVQFLAFHMHLCGTSHVCASCVVCVCFLSHLHVLLVLFACASHVTCMCFAWHTCTLLVWHVFALYLATGQHCTCMYAHVCYT